MARLLEMIQGHQETLAPLLEALGKGRLANTILFAGPSGIGKKLSAMALAQALVCERSETGNNACGECGPCLRLEKGQSESLLTLQPDGLSIKIEQAREALKFISLQKLGRSRVIIIDQAHLLNQQAANVLLKSLEEPPAGTYFMLLTSLAAAVLPTIRSRSLLVRFRPLNVDELARVLGPEADPWILSVSRGSLETAERLQQARDEFLELDQALFAFLQAAMKRFPSDEVAHLKELTKERLAQSFTAQLLMSWLRDALRARAGLETECSTHWSEFSQVTASRIQVEGLSRLAEKAFSFETDLARNLDRGLLLENFALDVRREAVARS